MTQSEWHHSLPDPGVRGMLEQTEEDKMASEMVERVARALADVDYSGLVAKGVRTEVKSWRIFADEARAAIEAMREPTEVMALAGDMKLDVMGFGQVQSYEANQVWSAMITAALQD